MKNLPPKVAIFALTALFSGTQWAEAQENVKKTPVKKIEGIQRIEEYFPVIAGSRRKYKFTLTFDLTGVPLRRGSLELEFGNKKPLGKYQVCHGQWRFQGMADYIKPLFHTEYHTVTDKGYGRVDPDDHVQTVMVPFPLKVGQKWGGENGSQLLEIADAALVGR